MRSLNAIYYYYYLLKTFQSGFSQLKIRLNFFNSTAHNGTVGVMCYRKIVNSSKISKGKKKPMSMFRHLQRQWFYFSSNVWNGGQTKWLSFL